MKVLVTGANGLIGANLVRELLSAGVEVRALVRGGADLSALQGLDLIPAIEAGFVAYSQGRCNIPPVGELLMDKGEVHIKYGCVTGDPTYVIKIASGFFGNPESGLSPNNGMMLLFSQQTGEPLAMLRDEAHLTDVRTAIAGAIAAKKRK